MSKVRIAGFTGEDPVSCFGVFVRESDRKVRLALTDAMARMYRTFSNEIKGDKLALVVSFEVAGGDWDLCERHASKIAALLEVMLPEPDGEGWLVTTTDEAERLIQLAVAVLGVTFGEPYRQQWTWLP